MNDFEAQVLYCPDSEELRFLPEGPYPLSDGRLSWVAIQHGPSATFGSLNLLDLATRSNTSIRLPGRPGFAFPTDRPGVFVVGMEREISLVDTHTGAIQQLVSHLDALVTDTIINDAVVWDDWLIVGCKDLKFSDPKAGLYLIGQGNSEPIQLRSDRVCSNGKAVRQDDGTCMLVDICSKSQRITRSPLDLAAGRLGPDEVVVDLTGEGVFPDGMILTPDGESLIVALYNPELRDAGEARQYSLASGELQARWTCPGSPRVTCPQLIEHAGRVVLVLTTADEGMPSAMRQACPQAGCLFVAETSFATAAAAPSYPTSGWP